MYEDIWGILYFYLLKYIKIFKIWFYIFIVVIIRLKGMRN